MQIALITPSLTTGEEAGGALEHAAVLTRWLFRQIQLLSCVFRQKYSRNPHIFLLSSASAAKCL